ncbi:MAG: hypothetical protein FGM18_09880 [Burkholderiaceae bacterium]|nr:hypothetical protein [Burkholderiaceae bacterium]
MNQRNDPGIATLIDLHDQIIDQGDGYWDRHASDSGVAYEFQNAHQLLADFFNEVDRVLKEVKSS